MTEVLLPNERETVRRKSSINQFDGFLAVEKQGGLAPIVFDQLDGITCDEIKTHPVAVVFGPHIGYVFPEAHCTYASDKFIYFDKTGVEKRLLPECFGGGGELYDAFVHNNVFVNFDDDTSAGVHEQIRLRTGLDYVLADETLPTDG